MVYWTFNLLPYGWKHKFWNRVQWPIIRWIVKRNFIRDGSVFFPRNMTLTGPRATDLVNHYVFHRFTSLATAVSNARDIYIWVQFLCFPPCILFPRLKGPLSFTTYDAHEIMANSRFSASAESFSSSVSSSPSTSEDCECLECVQIYPTPRTPPRFQRTFPSLSKLQIPATPLVWLVYLFSRGCRLTHRDSTLHRLRQPRFRSRKRK